jgi:hypothetical protein
MEQQLIDTIKAGIQDGSIIPYLGPQALTGASNIASGEPIPADSDSLILAMNNGKPMAPKLMYEFPRAAMNLELKRGRSFISRFLNKLYGETEWSRAPIHDWIKMVRPACVIDINRDLQLQQSYNDIPHNLMIGIARIGGTDFRYKLYHYDGSVYKEITNEEVDASLPLLLKPMGSPQPEANYIASDADYVDYITELMGGFGVPKFFKEYRKEKRYLLIGMSLNRDTERMVLHDISLDRAKESGWAVIPNATEKEKRFCRTKLNMEVIDMSLAEFMQAFGVELPDVVEA